MGGNDERSGVDSENVSTSVVVRKSEFDSSIDTSRSQQSRIQRIRSIITTSAILQSDRRGRTHRFVAIKTLMLPLGSNPSN